MHGENCTDVMCPVCPVSTDKGAQLWAHHTRTYSIRTAYTIACVGLGYIHVLMREEKEGRKKVKQTNKAKQHSTPKAVTFLKKNELPRVGLKPTTLYTLDRALYH